MIKQVGTKRHHYSHVLLNLIMFQFIPYTAWELYYSGLLYHCNHRSGHCTGQVDCYTGPVVQYIALGLQKFRDYSHVDLVESSIELAGKLFFSL